MAGVGKSTTGRRVAESLGRRFVDLDDAVEVAAGRTVAEIFRTAGEAGFREIESQVLSEVLGGLAPTVLATGGGAVLAPGNRALLGQRSTTVWLRAGVDELVARLTRSQVERPLLSGDVAANVAALDAVRRELYAEVADVMVDVDGLDRAEVVESVLDALATVESGVDGVVDGAEVPR